jgi:predicted enzyme related to lactoylglutathione lyase
MTVVPEHSSPAFATLRTDGGAVIGLQDRASAKFPPGLEKPGSIELSFEVEDVDVTWKHWQDKGVEMVADPMDLPFGRYFMAKDPEGYYLSVYRFNQK